MPIYPLNRPVAKLFSKLPLRAVLIVPFVLQTVSAVALVSFLSFKSGQEAVEDVAHQLIEQVGERISDRLTDNDGSRQSIPFWLGCASLGRDTLLLWIDRAI
jgi:hypothetical protein